jgi:hypothetical protein
MLLSPSAGDVSMWDNYVFDVGLKLNSVTGSASLLFRIKDPSNYYYFELDARAQVARLGKVSDGRRTVLVARAVRLEANTRYVAKVWAKDGILEGYINSSLVDESIDKTFSTGGVGLRVGAGSTAYFDNLWVIYEPIQRGLPE